MPDVESIIQRLDDDGYRVTAPRRVVVDEIVSRTTPFTSADLLETVQHKVPTIGRATVFRTLDLMCRMGVVQRIHEDAAGGRCHAYLACEERHHHHLICNSCGRVQDFHDTSALDALVRHVESYTDYRIDGHRLELTGTCPNCRAASEA